MDVIEAMRTARNIRTFEDRPVSDGAVDAIIEAATWAPSPGNSQGWDFVVVRDRATKAALGEAFWSTMRELRAIQAIEARPSESSAQDDFDQLLASLADVPVLIFVCGAAVYPPGEPMEEFVWSALYPATQNLRLAARAHGLAAAMTVSHMLAEPVVRDLLGIPEDVRIAATLAVGWPAQPFGQVRRRPAAEVTHRERWGTP